MVLTPMLKDDGKIIGDFLLSRLDDDSFLIIGSGIAKSYHMRWFLAHLPDTGDVQVKCKTSILASMVKFVEYQPMDVESLKKQVQLMRVLVAGCKKHPAYRAIRPATGNCEPCVKMWKARLTLEKFENRSHH